MVQDSTICIKDIMNAPPIGIESGSTLDWVINKLLTLKISRLFIFKDKKPVGIISEKDILNYFYNEKLQKRIAEVPVNEIMQNDIFFKDVSTTIPEAAKFMIDNKCSSIGISSHGDLVGIVTKTDFTKFYAKNYFGKSKVGSQMSSKFLSTIINDSLFDVIKKMLDSEISRMVIVSNERNPVGIVATGDIFRAVLDIEAKETTKKIMNVTLDYEKFWSRYKEFCSLPAEKVMGRGIMHVMENEDLANACKMILEKEINALVVPDTGGKIKGIIGKREILSTLINQS